MLFAVDLGIADVPVWALVLGGLALLVLAWRWLERDPEFGEFANESDGTRLAIPFYIERESLRNLAALYKVALPIAREVVKQRKLVARLPWLGGEGSRSETKQFSGDVDLAQLVRNLDEKLDYDACARDLGDAPVIEERGVLSGAISQLSATAGEFSKTRELLGQVEETYDRERSDTIIKRKRHQLADTASHEKLIFMRGKFEAAEQPGQGDAFVVLTHFDQPSFYQAYGPEDQNEGDLQPVPVPDGVGIRIALPDEEAFTPAGRERLRRGQPFYARLIAHSPSYDEESGILSCAAYGLWGTNRPRPQREYYGGC